MNHRSAFNTSGFKFLESSWKGIVKFLFQSFYQMKIIFIVLLSLWLCSASEFTPTTYAKIEKSINYTKDKEFSTYMMTACKNIADDPDHCFSLAIHCWRHETKFGTVSNKNIFGMISRGNINKYLAFNEWIRSYNKYWRNNTCKQMITKSVYSTTETNEWIYNCLRMQQQFNLLQPRIWKK